MDIEQKAEFYKGIADCFIERMIDLDGVIATIRYLHEIGIDFEEIEKELNFNKKDCEVVKNESK